MVRTDISAPGRFSASLRSMLYDFPADLSDEDAFIAWLMSAISSDWGKPVPGGSSGLMTRSPRPLNSMSSDWGNPFREVFFP